MSGSRRLTQLLTLIVALGGLSACGGEPDSPPASTTPTPSASTAASPTWPPPRPTIRTDQEACGGSTFNPKAVRPYNPDGPAYAGAGVHLAALFVMHSYAPVELESELPTEWQAQWQPGMYPEQNTQLVICEYFDDDYPSRKVETCTYRGSDGTRTTAELRSARFIYRVFEARTGKQVSRFTLPGRVNSCRAVVYGVARGTYYQLVLAEELTAKLRPLVLARRPG
ncbi:hypothetical protein [Micromonospora tarensis]|uniref:Uncharacterized protein n=1 Tax=Micromonospora tarensis TaxID=2806100 RepID=A0ABS1YG15_9ACTN|nr:hypothetical protein [Micromonospora tarensis]MBM0276151.1 hypothetical protein [Micromonospora tarensis]